MAVASVRDAAPEDAAEIAAIQARTWRAAYAELLPPDALDELAEAGAAEAWAAAIERARAGDGHRVLVAAEGEVTVGFCACGPASAEDLADATGAAPPDEDTAAAVATLLVEPRWGRRGHGGRLLAEATTGLRSTGATRGVVWVPERDEASAGFFAKAGWEPDGTVRTLDAGGRPLRELRRIGPLLPT